MEYENKDIRVSIVGAGRFTIERVAFDGKGGNIMLRSDEREHPRDQPVTPPAATRRPRAETARKSGPELVVPSGRARHYSWKAHLLREATAGMRLSLEPIRLALKKKRKGASGAYASI